jgi:hypothetical protein
MEEAAFDRLIARAHWGLPALVLSFDPASEVVTLHPGAAVDELRFRRERRAWEKIASVTLTQRLA